MKKLATLLLSIPALSWAAAARADSGWSIQFLFRSCAPFCGEVNGINMLDADIGIVVGGGSTALGRYSSVLFTNDKGDHWNVGLVPLGSGILNKTEFIDETTPIAGGGWGQEGNGTIPRSTDRGARWTSTVSGTRNSPAGVSFANADIGTAVGQ